MPQKQDSTTILPATGNTSVIIGGGGCGGVGGQMGGLNGSSSGNILSTQKMYAKAIYDNMAESPDELAFKRGDILMVIEQDTDGLDGWWLCTLRGRQGICPGNRLRIVPSYDCGCYSPSPVSSPCPSIASSGGSCGLGGGSNNGGQHYLHQTTNNIHTTTTSSSTGDLIYENTPLVKMNQNQKHGKRRSWHIMPNKVVTPQKCGDVYLYDLLPSPSPPPPLSVTPSAAAAPTAAFHHHQYQQQQNFHRGNSILNQSTMSTDSDTYDTPKPAVHINYDSPRVWTKTPPQVGAGRDLRPNSIGATNTDECYDIPRPVTLLAQQNLTPSSSNSSLLTSDSLSLSSSNRSSLANMPDYDVPRRNPPSIRSTPPPTSTFSSVIVNSQQMAYDFPGHNPSQPSVLSVSRKELPLELSSALETLAKLQNEATSAVTRLLGFVTPNWRVREKLDPMLMDVKLAAVRLRTALHDLAEFGDGALGNAARADDKGLSIKLRPLVRALKDADKLIHEASESLDFHGWTVENLARPSDQKQSPSQQQQIPPDSLDQLIACALTLTEDVRQTASFIQGNATLLFKRTTTTTTSSGANSPQSTPNGNNNNEWLEDYDYVSLESKEVSAKKNAEIRDALPSDLQKNFDNVIKNAESAAICNNGKAVELDPNDKTLLVYYATQTVTHMNYLTQAIDAFLQTVEHNQPPKFFLAHGKFVVLSAHNLVNIGDIVHRNVTRQDVRTKILHCADALNDGMKTCVVKTKKAAQHFPSVTAVQEMVDSVVDISHLASDLKVAMVQAVHQ